MCIAIFKPPGRMIPEEHLEESWRFNDDGGGYMFAEDQVLKMHYGFKSFKSWLRSYRKNVRVSSPAVLHFRIATHGGISQLNCHPHRINPTLGVAHNGILSNVSIPDEKWSDTVAFVRTILKKMPENFYKNDQYCSLLEEAIGTGNKLVFLDNTGYYRIINMKAGVWDNGCWYSNRSYVKWPSYACNLYSNPQSRHYTQTPLWDDWEYGRDTAATTSDCWTQEILEGRRRGKNSVICKECNCILTSKNNWQCPDCALIEKGD